LGDRPDRPSLKPRRRCLRHTRRRGRPTKQPNKDSEALVMAREAAWMIDESILHLPHAAEWHRLYEASIAKCINKSTRLALMRGARRSPASTAAWGHSAGCCAPKRKRETPKKKAVTSAERQAKWRLSHGKVTDVLSPPTLLLACHPTAKRTCRIPTKHPDARLVRC
jgi:hypothetical protein